MIELGESENSTRALRGSNQVPLMPRTYHSCVLTNARREKATMGVPGAQRLQYVLDMRQGGMIMSPCRSKLR